MKIALIRKKYSFHGGAERHSHDLIAHLTKAGHEVHVYAAKWEDGAEDKNLKFHRVPWIKLTSIIRDLSFALSSYFILKKADFDVIQSQDKTLVQDIYFAGDGCHIEWLKQRWKRKKMFGRLAIALNPYHWMILAIERMIFNGHRFKRIVAISELVKRNILDNYRVDPADISVVYHGVDLEKYTPENKNRYRQEIRRQYSIADDASVILFVGSGFERKGVEFLIKAAELVSEPVTVLIVGKGSEKKYSKYAAGKNVVFCGPQKDIYKYYGASDVFVSPAVYEPFGLVYLEALASGLPVITSKNAGAAEIIQDGITGYVVQEPEDVKAMAEKIESVLNDNSRLHLISTNARLLAEKFTFEKHVSSMQTIYENICSK